MAAHEEAFFGEAVLGNAYSGAGVLKWNYFGDAKAAVDSFDSLGLTSKIRLLRVTCMQIWIMPIM